MTTGFRPRRGYAYKNCDPTGYTRSLNMTNVGESDKAYHIEIATPGWSKDEISIEVKDGHLVVDGSAANVEASEIKFHKRQFTKSNFTRRFVMPSDANEDKIKAKFENGVLHITLAKDKVEPVSKQIKIS